MAVETEFLQALPYFAGIDPAELDSIKGFFFEKAFERGDMILFEGGDSEALYLVFSGVVKLFKTSADGKEQILKLVRPGEPLNDVSVFDGGPSPTGAQAMGPVGLYGVQIDDLEAILRDHPQVTRSVNKVLAGQVRDLMALVEDLSFRRVTGRVAKILLEHASNGAAPKQRLTQQDIAGMAGTVREVVGRALKTLEEEGAIRLERHRVVINDREALRQLVDAD